MVIIGGGLAGLSAAHTVLEQGGAVVLLDKMKFLGGNSTRATSGINGAHAPATPPAALRARADASMHPARGRVVYLAACVRASRAQKMHRTLWALMASLWHARRRADAGAALAGHRGLARDL